MATEKFIYDISSHNADLFYATRFSVHDPIIFIEVRGKKYLVLNDLEIDRGKRQAKVHRVLSLSAYQRKANERKKNATLVDVLQTIFNDFRIKRLIVPTSTSFALVDSLRRKGFRVEQGSRPFYPKRAIKTAAEQRLIEEAQRVVFSAFEWTEHIVHASRVRGNRLVYRGTLLTSERLQSLISVFLLERGYSTADPPIVAGGIQACDPHEIGHGPLKPHEAIVVDIFPRSLTTGFHGDATRTFCKGRAPDALKRLYATVLEGQKLGIAMVRAGRNGKKIHTAITNLFAKKGFPTGEKNGRMQGFFHGTGHGIGLEVHEEPARIGKMDCILKPNLVMSVEPGLYYPAIGGVRIEDLVVVTKTGCRVLSRYPKVLEIR